MKTATPHADDRRAVVTGVGLLTSVGSDRESTWRALKRGECGTRRLAGIRVGRGEPAFGAPALGPSGDGAVEPVLSLALTAAGEALVDSGLELDATNRDRVGCIVGSSKGGLASLRRMFAVSDNDSSAAVFWQNFLPHAAASAVASRFDLTGPLECPIAACATGLVTVLKAVDYIRDGSCDVVLAGCADASLEPSVLAAFHRMGVLARGFDDPQRACRPFDARRNGFLVGEGAGMFVVESVAHARRRGATVYAELLGGTTMAEAGDVTRLDCESPTLSRLITTVLRRAELAPDEVGYVNLHGTATRQNDVYETRSLKRALGSAVWRIPLSGTKPMIGHTLGASGGIELAVCLLAMRDGIVPPTINLDEPDRECDLDYTPGVARRRAVETAMKLSLGFGGHVAGVALRKF